jgi:hypothetical protein
LKDPKDLSKSAAISNTIGGIDQAQAIVINHKASPFLLLTQGGLDQVDGLVKMNRHFRF